MNSVHIRRLFISLEEKNDSKIIPNGEHYASLIDYFLINQLFHP